MEQAFSKQLCEISDNMGVGLYQRMTMLEASLFLRCPLKSIQQLITQNKIGYITLPNADIEFFGYQLLDYLLQQVSTPVQSKQTTQSQPREKILRIEEITKMVGLSRSTIWRMETKGTFPARVPLGTRSVGWRSIEIEEWIAKR